CGIADRRLLTPGPACRVRGPSRKPRRTGVGTVIPFRGRFAMVTEPHCQLTTRDHAILQSMLERYRGPRGPYLQLLERKVRDSSICFRADVPPDVVTIDTRLVYLVDGIRKGPHQLVHGDGAESLPPFALSIRTVRGLALLGL